MTGNGTATNDGWAVATYGWRVRAVACALAFGFEIRAGLHTGEIEPNGEKVAGIAVHIGARVMAHAGPSQVLVSATVKDLTAGAGINYEPHGVYALKGVPGEWVLHRALEN